jgi:putative protein kinase ArgK-like GTPase of G3E family
MKRNILSKITISALTIVIFGLTGCGGGGSTTLVEDPKLNSNIAEIATDSIITTPSSLKD